MQRTPHAWAVSTQKARSSDRVEFIPIVNLSQWTPNSAPNTDATARVAEAAYNITGGALFLTTINYRPGKGSRGLDWGGGCYWALTDAEAALEPGKATLIGTGIEDYFNCGFAFGFFGKHVEIRMELSLPTKNLLEDTDGLRCPRWTRWKVGGDAAHQRPLGAVPCFSRVLLTRLCI